ncbi:MAG: NUMOD4 domain-containing protein [Acidobacteriota bacterium]|nr:NUMOD4 domain-containing protein [Acidobacteriota bacterium]
MTAFSITEKPCSTCKIIKPASAFTTRPKLKRGFDYRCKECNCNASLFKKRPQKTISIITNEEWRDIVGYEGIYQVSNFGRICRISKYGEKSLLSPGVCNGYFRVNLCSGNRAKKEFVHRLVAAAFLKPDAVRKWVNHKDAIKTNNAIYNLEYVTMLENSAHAKKLGLHLSGERHAFRRDPSRIPRGEERGWSKFTNQQVKEIKQMLADKTYTGAELARIYNVSPSTISSIKHNRNWKGIG